MTTDTLKRQDVLIREASTVDLEAISSIYNHYVTTSTATFDVEPRSASHFRDWFEDHRRDHLPMFVAELNGQVIGWASLSLYKERCAYRSTLEPSVYMHPSFVSQGIGRNLAVRLISTARQRRYHCLVGLICSENKASIKLLEALGFERVGEMKEVGRKFDRWLNVTILQKVLTH